MSKLTKNTLISLLPPGSAWNPVKGGDFDNFLEAFADSIDNPKDFLARLSDIRNPLTTPLLDELEIEFGVTKNTNLTEVERRQYLNSLIFPSDENGTDDDLQSRLQGAGFNVQVHTNDPATDPAILLDNSFQMVAGGGNAYAGRPDAYARRVGGELIVNGDQYIQRPNYIAAAGNQNIVAGNQNANAGVFDGLILIEIQYRIPTDPGDWPLLFYLGGDVTRDGGGFITALETVILPIEIREEFLQLVLKYKPLHTWAISTVNFI